MIYKNIMESLCDLKKESKPPAVNYDNYGLGREYDLLEIKNKKKGKLFNQDKIEMLNDRDLFNKTSNMSEEVDMSNTDFLSTFGMPTFSGQIFKNKKAFIRTPFIQEDNDKSGFVSSSSNLNNTFASVSGGINTDEKLMDTLTFMGYNTEVNDNEVDDKCKIEEDITNFEHGVNLNKKKNFIFDVNSPFALAYLWKSLIAMTKNPTTEKIMSSMKIMKKEMIVNELKKYSDIFNDFGILEYYVPVLDNQIDKNTVNKLEELYKINLIIIDDVRDYDELENAQISLKYNFTLEIPLVYKPYEKHDYFLNFKNNKTKFIELSNVMTSLIISEKKDFVNLEIPMGSDFVLGFIYNTERQMLEEIDYSLINAQKKFNTLIETLIIPKINRNKKSEYSKNFKNILSHVHFGDIHYGKLYDVDININVNLEIEAVNEKIKLKDKLENKIQKINVNHPCYFYIRHLEIKNRIFINGFINY